MYLEIPQVPLASCTIYSIGQLPTTSKGNRYALTSICLLTYYLITVPLKTKTADKVSMACMKEILPKTSFSKFILQDNWTEFKNKQLKSIFDTLGIKQIYSNPYYSRGTRRIANVHNFLKRTMATFMHWSQLEWDYALPLVTYCYNIAPSVDDLESPFYLVHGRDPLGGRLSNLQNYCRYVGDQPGQLAVQELRKMWKCYAKLLNEKRRIDPVETPKSLKQPI